MNRFCYDMVIRTAQSIVDMGLEPSRSDLSRCVAVCQAAVAADHQFPSPLLILVRAKKQWIALPDVRFEDAFEAEVYCRKHLQSVPWRIVSLCPTREKDLQL